MVAGNNQQNKTGRQRNTGTTDRKFRIKQEGRDIQEQRIGSLGFMCWAIWKQKNNHIFQGKEISPNRIIQAVKVMQIEFLSAIEQVKMKHKGAENRRMRNATWRAPPKDWLKINVDASFRKFNRKGAMATVLRDWQEKFIAGSATEIRAFSSLEAEALALKKALIMAKNLQLKKVLIESDNLQLIQSIKSKSYIGEILAYLKDIAHLLKDLPDAGITWTPGEENHLAHLIATQRAVGTLSSNWSVRLQVIIETQLRREAEKVRRIGGRPTHHEGAIEQNENWVLTVPNQVVIEVREGTGGGSGQRSNMRLSQKIVTNRGSGFGVGGLLSLGRVEGLSPRPKRKNATTPQNNGFHTGATKKKMLHNMKNSAVSLVQQMGRFSGYWVG
ncbi:hypothetical protein Ahy_A04g021134 [Arachis hypogaea]|uniref:RNase H type-1 domain-containing protein n=1 Tax=Arachis hypogaea TaxID=3818 RepID=A0A445DJE7_ARAHY|nr:hypothetical protein Ahy_A04g021134 [Arachis hypogaea]